MEAQASAPLIDGDPRATNPQMLEAFLSLFIETIFIPPHTENDRSIINRIETDRQTYNWTSIWEKARLDQRFDTFLEPIATDVLYSYRSRDPKSGRELRPDHVVISHDLTEEEVEACLAQNEAIAPYLYMTFNLLRTRQINPIYRNVSIQWNGAFIALIRNPDWDHQSPMSASFEVWYLKNAVVDGISLLIYEPRSPGSNHRIRSWPSADGLGLVVLFVVAAAGLATLIAMSRS